MEKLKPQKQRSVISSLKFQRKTDYKKFLKFIKLETKRLKGIEKPKESKVKDILNAGTIGLSAFGIFSLVEKGRDAINKIKGIRDDFQTPFAIGRVRDDDKKLKKKIAIGEEGFKKRIIAKKFSPNLNKKINVSKVRDAYTSIVSGGRKIGKKFGEETKQQSDSQRKIVTETKGTERQRAAKQINAPDQNQGRTTTITKDNITGSKGTERRRLAQQYQRGNRSGEVFMDMDGSFKTNYNDLSQQAKDINDKINRIENTLNDPNRKLTPSKQRRLIKDLNRLQGRIMGTVKPNILERFMNFYNKGRNVRFPDESKARFGTPLEYFKEKPDPTTLFGDDRLQMTQADEAFKTGKKGIRTLRPLKAFTLEMLKTGPTPLTRQIIERPFKSLLSAGSGISKILFKNPLVNALLKSKVTKTGLFVIDAIFAGQEFYDLFMRPGDNVYTTLHDLYVSINNAYFHDDPEKLRYFITESKGSSKLFGVGPGLTNEQIRRKEIERNLRIKRLKQAATVKGGGGNNVIVVPQNQQNTNMGGSNNSPGTTGGDEISFLPFEPLNIGDDILLHKLNQ